MLVEFRVSNFRSIKDEQVLSLVASKDKSLRENNVHATGIPAVPSILRSAAIYGANASGKSNLIKALQFMQSVVLGSGIKKPEGMRFDIKPFLLDENTVSSPSSFEITFLIDQTRFQYGFSMTKDRVVSEHLLVYKKFKPQQWFRRSLDQQTEQDSYEFKTGLTGPKHVWQEATRQDSLFLSVATTLNSKDIKPIYDWFDEGLVIINDQVRLSPEYSAELISNDEKRESIIGFLKSADINIENIDVEKKEGKLPTILFYHLINNGNNGNVAFDLDDESAGTQALFALIGPSLDILENGKTLIVDEIDTSLHPLLLRAFIKLFHDKENNTGAAQLIFSTHDTSLLDTFGLFRRDQIYFTEKGNDQATELISLAEFSPRKTDNVERSYLSGRYGGIPLVDPEMKLRL